jgi:hypothetical protein
MDWQDDEPLLMQNERLGLASDFMDSWTLEQRENFMMDWQDDEPLLQVGRAQKRSIDEVNDGAGTSEQVSDNFFTVSNVKGIQQYIFLLFHLEELLKLYVNLFYRFCVTLLFLEIFEQKKSQIS